MSEAEGLKGIKVYIAFEEAMFRMHLTKAFRDTYLAPLPTSVAGMFGALLGLRRDDVFPKFKGFMFGSRLVKYKGKSKEYATLLQLKSSRAYTSTQIPMFILVEPEYEIVIAGPDKEIEEMYGRLIDGFQYFPYGGSSDYLAVDVRLIGMDEPSIGKTIQNYAPVDNVEDIKLDRDGELSVGTVKMRGCQEAIDFYFVYRGELHLKEPIVLLDGVGLYKLEDFCYRMWGE